MVKVSVRLDVRHRLKDGTYPLKLAVARQGTFWLPLDIYLREEDWDADNERIINLANRKSLNALIQQRQSEVNMKLMALQNNGTLRSYTKAALIAYLQDDSDDNQPHLFSVMAERFLRLKDNASTKRIYEDTIRLMKDFCKYESLTFEEMTVSWLNTFNIYARESCPSKNGRAIHFRNIRAIFNYAIKEDYITCYPFRKFKIEHEQTEKRSLSLEQMRRLASMPLKPFQERYRDTFMLVFMLIGINSIDLSRLKEVKNGRISYKRGKTHKIYDIKVEPEAQAIIDRYKGKEHLLNWFDSVKNYRNYANRANLSLHDIGKEFGAEGFTVYWARHTWATFAAELDIPEDTISLALGHSTTGAEVTKVYIRYNHKKVDDANRRVIDYALGKGEFADDEELESWD
jgi:hypothetical protein